MADQNSAPAGFSIVDAANAAPNTQYTDRRYCKLHLQLGEQVRLSIYNPRQVCNSCLELLTAEAKRKSDECSARLDVGPKLTFTELALQELLEEPPGQETA